MHSRAPDLLKSEVCFPRTEAFHCKMQIANLKFAFCNLQSFLNPPVIGLISFEAPAELY